MSQTRTERDTFGPIAVPADKLWGAQTQRSLENFRIGGERMPVPLVRALGTVKRAAAVTNQELGLLEPRLAEAIVAAADEVIAGRHRRRHRAQRARPLRRTRGERDRRGDRLPLRHRAEQVRGARG